jgi:hypothetical protein
MALDLTDLTTVKAFLNIGGSSADTALGYLIPYVSRRIERHCRRPDGFELKSRVEVVSRVPEIPAGKAWGYSLKVAPVTSIASIIVDEDHAFTGTGATTLTDGDDFTWSPEQGRVIFDGYRPPEGHRTVQITYTGGIAANTAALIANADHQDLVLAASLQVQYVYERRNSLGATSKTVNDSKTTTQPELALLKEVRELLAPWVRRRFQ